MKGKREYGLFKNGEPLTHKQAILAQCFICNGIDEGGEDCRGTSCPLYQFMPYRKDRVKRQISAAERQRLTAQLKRVRNH